MINRTKKNTLHSLTLLNVLVLYLAINYLHPVFSHHHLNHSNPSTHGLKQAESFNCSIFHDMYFEFRIFISDFENPNPEYSFTILKICDKVYSNRFLNFEKSRAPPVFNF
ncbi:MAG: hypothetical protein ACM3PT_02670 [Deltaproteobacteria bacterium]